MKENIVPSAEPQGPEMSGARFCMVCLNTSEDCRLYASNTYNLDMEYEHLTGISLQGLTQFEAQFCAECAQRLSNCSKFRDRSLRAYHLLMGLVEEQETIKTQDLISLGRSNYLASSIVKKTFEPDHCDLYLKHKKHEDNEEIGKPLEKTKQETTDNKTVSIEIECVNGNLILKPVKENENSDNVQTGEEDNSDDDDFEVDDDDFEVDDSSDSNSDSDSDSTATNKEPDSDLQPKVGKRKGPLKIEELFKYYNVTELTQEEQLADLEKRKERDNNYNIRRPHKCLICYKRFHFLKYFKKHMDKHTDKRGQCVCPVCGLHYRTKRQLRRHVDNVHRKRYSCKSCTFLTNEMSTAWKHLNWHKREWYTCPHCLEELSSKSLYQLHLWHVHCSELTCTLCHKAFRTERGLRCHIKLKHCREKQNKKQYFCEECNIRFMSEETYRQHLEESDKHAADGNIKDEEMTSGSEDDVNIQHVSEKLIENVVQEKDIEKINKEEEPYNCDSKMENFEDIPTEYLEDFDDFLDVDINLQSQVSNEDTKNVAVSTNIEQYKNTIEERLLESRIMIKKPKKDVDYEYLKEYTITWLSHEQQCEEIQKRRESTNFLKSEFKCGICFKGFCYINTYKTHMDKHTDKYGQFECPVCWLRYPTRIRLRNHIGGNHSRRYACNRCPMVTNLRGTAVNHAKWHAGTVYQCPHCPEVSISKSASFCHIRINHPTDVVCALCGFCFMNKRGLRKHVLMKHRLENVQNPSGPLCEACDVRFASEAAHQQHLKVSPKHAAGRKLVRNTPLTKGSKNRLPKITKDPVKCEQCGLRLQSYRAYYHHFRIDHPDKARTQLPHAALLCELCGGAFGDSSHLQKHMLKHTGSRPYQCDTCSRTFYTKHGITLHVQTHDASRPTHACPVCGRHFTNKPNRDRHVWTHKKRKPYPCDECDRTFADNSARREHVQHVHRRRPYPRRPRGPPQRNSRPRGALLAVFGAARVEQPAPDVEMLED